MDGSIKAVIIGGVLLTAGLIGIGLCINSSQKADAKAGKTQTNGFIGFQQKQMEMMERAMDQAEKMADMQNQHMRMMEMEMAGAYGDFREYDAYGTRQSAVDQDFYDDYDYQP